MQNNNEEQPVCENAGIAKAKQLSRWHTFGLVGLGLLASITWGTSVLFYLAGRWPMLSTSGVELLGFIGPALVAFACMIMLTMVLKRNWFQLGGSSRAWMLSGILVLIVAIVAAMMFAPSRKVSFQHGFRERMRLKADIEGIRSWEGKLAASRSTIHDFIDPAEWSASVRELSPRLVFYTSESREVRLIWGGGFVGRWGLIVSPEDMEQPGAFPEATILAPGAYVYRSYK